MQSTRRGHPSQDIQKSLYLLLRVKDWLIPEVFLLSSINKMMILFFFFFSPSPLLSLSIFKLVLEFIQYVAEMLVISINNMQEESYRILMIFHPSLCMPVRDAFSLWLQKTCSTKGSVSTPLKWVDIRYCGLFKKF